MTLEYLSGILPSPNLKLYFWRSTRLCLIMRPTFQTWIRESFIYSNFLLFLVPTYLWLASLYFQLFTLKTLQSSLILYCLFLVPIQYLWFFPFIFIPHFTTLVFLTSYIVNSYMINSKLMYLWCHTEKKFKVFPTCENDRVKQEKK